MSYPSVSFGDLVALLGPAAGRKVLDARAGRHLHIPAHLVEGSPLIVILGHADATRLVQAFGATVVQVPILRAKRDRIRFLRRRLHWSVSAIAADMRCTIRYVYAVLAEPDPDDTNEVETDEARGQLGLPF